MFIPKHLRLVFAILLFSLSHPVFAQEQNKNSQQYDVRISLNQDHQSVGSKFYIYIEVPKEFPYTFNFDVENNSPNIQVSHSLSDNILSLASKDTVFNAWVTIVQEPDSPYQGVKVVIGGIREEEITIVLSKFFKPKFRSSANHAE